MKVFAYTAVAVVLFFAFAIHLVRKEERRRSDRRQEDLPVLPPDPRRRDRRRGNVFSYLGWVLRSLLAKPRQ
ncbi:MAG TPA: hypothetical protein VJ528_11730 [Geothrix sp.]|nr:hypothetical protein [Geothrix sp.]